MPVAPPIFRPSGSKSRQQGERVNDARRREREPWRGWYNLAVWRNLRSAQLRREPLCETCLLTDDRVTAANTVHHRVPHRGDWSLFIEPDNHASVCKTCHDGEIQRGERAGWTRHGWEIDGNTIPVRVVQPLGLTASAIPLIIVCGPPAAGKTSYVRTRAREGDTVIDLDAFLDRLSGMTVRTAERRQVHLQDALIERNRMLATLCDASDGTAWFIVDAPRASVRELWASQLQPSAMVVMETPAAECIRRIRSDPGRTPIASRMVEGVHQWWDRYEPSHSDTLHLR